MISSFAFSYANVIAGIISNPRSIHKIMIVEIGRGISSRMMITTTTNAQIARVWEERRFVERAVESQLTLAQQLAKGV